MVSLSEAGFPADVLFFTLPQKVQSLRMIGSERYHATEHPHISDRDCRETALSPYESSFQRHHFTCCRDTAAFGYLPTSLSYLVHLVHSVHLVHYVHLASRALRASCVSCIMCILCLVHYVHLGHLARRISLDYRASCLS
jgi:hypothetical protein